MATNISNHKREKKNDLAPQYPYLGKKVYVGIDVHKHSYSRTGTATAVNSDSTTRT
jgi:hypothetical protein